MKRFLCICPALAMLLLSAAFAADEPEFPKAPGRALIAATSATEETQVNEWITALIQAKEKRAMVELEQIKKQVKTETDAENAKDRERRKRRVAETGTEDAEADKSAPVHIKMEFQVPEITTYRAAVEVCHLRQTLANDIVQALTNIKETSDGKFAGESYLQAAALVAGSAKLLAPLEGEGGFLTETSLLAAADIPQTAAGAMRTGRKDVEVKGYRVKPYDADGNGVLDVAERKAMATAFSDIAVRAAHDAEFYGRVVNTLTAARDAAALKFADVEVTP